MSSRHQGVVESLPRLEREAVLRLAGEVREAGGRLYLVGGSVRDALLGFPVKDVDAEVFGLQPAALEKLLARRHAFIEVGRSFGVYKLKGLEFDVSLPRREEKCGRGHRGFAVEPDPFLPVETAAARRDFTINAILCDPTTGEVIDPHGGQRDLRDKVLRHVSEAFAEDPLRVLRGMQFIARFHLRPAEETLRLCREITPEGLPPERYFEEWKKLLLKGQSLSRGLAFLRDTGWVRYFPELEALIGCPQDPEWHPEGDVWVHTLHCLDAFARERLENEWEDLIVGFAVLCHDLGKPLTTRFEDGRWRSPGHEVAGEGPTRSFLDRLTRHKDLIEEVVPLVRTHLRPMMLWKTEAGDGAIRRLAREVGRVDRLARVVRADVAGRPPREPTEWAVVDWLLERAAQLRVREEAPKPLILGRHLMRLGLQPGPHFKGLLDRLFDEQLGGGFSSEEEGLERARALIAEGVASAGPSGNAKPPAAG